ncbi:Uroporphyrinogen decarboxylase [Chlamydiales bacterium SCGC AG-110-M15]|nr:Uroporphyrinogen decarboxylase [Chlamydiales bacterium SCGC AG-110-M15]
MMNDRILRALRCENYNSPPPIWVMRQAGRYMPEYMALRKRHSLLELFHSPELAADVTMLPIDAFAPDAAILFSDILVIVEALGLGLEFKEKQGPVIERPINSEKDIHHLPRIDLEESLAFVYETIKLLKPRLDVPLLGFSGAPFTLASYMIEGGSSRDLAKTRKLAYNSPLVLHQLLDTLTEHVIQHLRLQIKAGVNAVQIFDSWANHLSPSLFKTFIAPYLERIVKALKDSGTPVIIFCRGTSAFVDQLTELKPSAISIDWSCDIADFRARCPEGIAIQGNMDPYVLSASHECIKKEVHRLIDAMHGHPGYIFNLGHGITPDIPYENMRYLINTVKELREELAAETVN